MCLLFISGITAKAQIDSLAEASFAQAGWPDSLKVDSLKADSLRLASVVKRLEVILEEYNQEVVYVDTSEYLTYIADANDFNLQIASSMGACNEIIRLFIRGANVNNLVGNTATPLHYAVASGKVAAAEMLLLLRANPDSYDVYGNTPLISAVRSNNLEIAETLIRYDASLTAPDRFNSAPLHHAAALGLFYIADLLLYYESPTELYDNEGNTPLMTAVSFGYFDIADLLLQHEANPNASDRKGFTPIMSAAQNNDTLMMRLLLNAGANLYAMNAVGLDALGTAVIGGNKDAVIFLLRNGNRWDYTGRTESDPVVLARTYEHKEISRLLADKGMERKRGFSPDKFIMSAGGMFTSNYNMITASVSVADPGLRSGITLGTAFNPLIQRVLIDRDEETIYQYRVTTSVIYAGLFREFLFNKPYSKNKWKIFTTLSAGYRFHSLYEGTNDKPEDRFCIIPSAEFSWSRKNLSVTPGFTYLNTPFYKVSPVWFTLKVSYALLQGPEGFAGKKIKLYKYEKN